MEAGRPGAGNRGPSSSCSSARGRRPWLTPESVRGGPAEPADQLLGLPAASCRATMGKSGGVQPPAVGRGLLSLGVNLPSVLYIHKGFHIHPAILTTPTLRKERGSHPLQGQVKKLTPRAGTLGGTTVLPGRLSPCLEASSGARAGGGSGWPYTDTGGQLMGPGTTDSVSDTSS